MKAVMLTNKNNEVMKTLYHSSFKIHVISALLWAPLVYYIYIHVYLLTSRAYEQVLPQCMLSGFRLFTFDILTNYSHFFTCSFLCCVLYHEFIGLVLIWVIECRGYIDNSH